MRQPEIAASTRTVLGKKVKAMRRGGVIPAHIYGRGVSSQAIQVEVAQLRQSMAGYGHNVLISLQVDSGAPVTALIREVQTDPLTDALLHVDFYAVSMTQKVRIDVPLNLVGVAPAVRDSGGIVVQSLDILEVECLPSDILPQVDVDITTLTKLDQAIFVRDLQLPQSWDLISDSEQMVVKVEPPSVVEEAPAPKAALIEEAPSEEKVEASEEASASKAD